MPLHQHRSDNLNLNLFQYHNTEFHIFILLTYIAVVIPGAVHVASNTTSGLPSRADSIRPAVSRASRVARSVLQSAVFFAKSSLAWFISAKKNKKRGISLYTG